MTIKLAGNGTDGKKEQESGRNTKRKETKEAKKPGRTAPQSSRDGEQRSSATEWPTVTDTSLRAPPLRAPEAGRSPYAMPCHAMPDRAEQLTRSVGGGIPYGEASLARAGE